MRPWIAVSGALIFAGVGLFLYKVFVLGYPLSTAEEPGTWRVDLVVAITGSGSRSVVDIPLPRTSGYQRLLAEEVKSEQMRFSISEAEGDRRGRWSGRLDGASSLTYEVTFDALAYSRAIPETDAGGTYPASAVAALAASPGIQPTDPAVLELSRELVLDSKNKAALAMQVYEFVAREIGALRSTAAMDAVTVIREGRGSDIGRARLFCALARANGLPCRVIAGIRLANGRQDQFRYWNEAYVGGGWIPFDVVERRAGALPADRLSLGPSSEPEVVRATNASAISFRFDVQSELQTYAELVRRRLAASQHPLDRLSLLFLPVQLQHTLRILLLVPLGALAMCVLRNIVGLKTFGMFMPMLIALAFTGTGLAWGTVFLATIVGFALISRLWIERLYLLLAARIAFILTLVVLLMVALFVVGERFGMPSSGVGAFPFVIMTMIVERISVSLEEEGAANTVRRIAATLAAIYLTYAVIRARGLQTLFLVYPELLLVILGLLVAVGRYTGYRLTELIRFRELADAPPSRPIQ
jgi:7 transmembrane helices usually fused to an inactive transglutaminase/Transglutaminase-like superfamily/Inactive transglutaminase fused to 7 transmembrane helices